MHISGVGEGEKLRLWDWKSLLWVVVRNWVSLGQYWEVLTISTEEDFGICVQLYTPS